VAPAWRGLVRVMGRLLFFDIASFLRLRFFPVFFELMI
jgi:hypothetical protein